jgi:hypothetical protein
VPSSFFSEKVIAIITWISVLHKKAAGCLRCRGIHNFTPLPSGK